MNLTDAAEQKVIELIKTEDDAVAMRIGVVGGGCSGFNYMFGFAEKIEEGDIVINDHDAIVVVDPMSYQYLEEATVDYTTNIEGERFIINNPGAATTCGCGTSFSV